MYYSRRTLGFVSAALVVSAASVAIAQEENPPQMLGQMQQGQMQQGQPAMPPSVPAGAYRQWPVSPAPATAPEEYDEYDDNTISSEGGGAIPSLPLEVQSMGGVTFITGGIGDEELEQIKASEHDYNLHILMSATGGAFVSDVDLRLTDATGKELVSIQGAGPYFYAKLPAGSYTVELNDSGESKKIPVKIGTNSNIKKVVEFKEPGGLITPHQPTATVE